MSKGEKNGVCDCDCGCGGGGGGLELLLTGALGVSCDTSFQCN